MSGQVVSETMSVHPRLYLAVMKLILILTHVISHIVFFGISISLSQTFSVNAYFH